MSQESSLVEIFRQEAAELLSEVQECLLLIEDDASNQEAIHRLFRAMHSIKGAGGMFGYQRVTDFTHHVETALDHVRSGKQVVTRKLIDLVLASHDCIHDMLDHEAGVEEARLQAVIAGLQELSPTVELAKESAKKVPRAAQQKATYRIRFRPARTIFQTGNDPMRLLEELQELGEVRITWAVSHSKCNRFPS